MTNPINIIAVGGGKGGIGKSVVCTNLAAGMALSGQKVILMDTDFGASNHRFGFFLGSGLASFKNGAAAIYTHRQKKFRDRVLGVDWNGYRWEEGVPENRGWQRSAAGLFLQNQDSSQLFVVKF